MLTPAPAAGPSNAATPTAEDGTTSSDTIVAEPDEAIISAPAPDRLEMLRSKPEAVGRFMELMVYAASVILSIPIKTLTALLKAVSFLDPDGLKRVLTFVPVASFTSSILSSKGHPTLVIGALQVVDLLLTKIDLLAAARALISAKPKEKDSTDSESPVPSDTPGVPPPLAPVPQKPPRPKTRLLYARVIQFKSLSGDDSEQDEGDESFGTLQQLVQRLGQDETEKEVTEVLGVVDGLLLFATDPEQKLSLQKRKDAFVGRKLKAGNNSPFANFVKKLQESLTKMESFEVVTVTPGADDSKRSSPSLLARQLRLRLVADDQANIPRNLHNIVVSIHAIATFQALHDYLRPRVAGLLGTGSRLSGMLAALANSGFPGVPRPPAPEDASTSAQASSSSTTTTRPRLPLRRACRRRRANMVDAEMANYNDEDEVDAEVFDEEIDRYNPIANKTLTLSVGEG
ncbi:Ubiquitin-protein ligase [Mycena chlorophos]|uniref:Ubiquitin-protein ligase n=1 Tax=Mycena chlorophos TaxID=658473 RepID=A0A8H6T9K1_MYCCL|nr:Ubiquitin-protein ligase [Mycena chlorophos]